MTRHFYPLVLLVCGLTLSAQAISSFGQDADKSRFDDWVKRLDANGDGLLDQEELKSREASMLRRMIQGKDGIDDTKPIAVADITKIIEESRRERGDDERRDDGGKRGDERRGDDRERETRREDERPASSREDSELSEKELRRRDAIAKLKLRSNYKMSDPAANLPNGVPEWFEERDANGDGQIRMSEFATEWTSSLLDEFSKYDRNRDGVITPQECIDLEEKGPLNLPERVASYSRLGSSSADRDRSKSAAPRRTGSSRSRDKNAAIMKYVEGVYAKYDKNTDGVLTEDEVAEMSIAPKDADTDGDGKITKEEYAETQK